MKFYRQKAQSPEAETLRGWNPIVASNKLVDYCKQKDILAERLFGEKELFYNR